MTFEELRRQESAAGVGERMPSAGIALQDLLVSARKQDCLTVGVYESAKVMNLDPDSVAFCVLATDEEFECDIALQIHFTLIQAFCFDNDISIVRVTDMQRLADIVGPKSRELDDAHCVLVTNPASGWRQDPALAQLSVFCEERRGVCDWVPVVPLPDR
ncbi:growth arrest and DNA damage-inducible protein GADD45 gamma-like [Megalops cyprinoides]|uniref:growth arrest and DNA damage-inducible protein GADD45 gamma-like n=1 Tax=Megalops cyprinoides TaxID=118141 RepID=UPI00186534C9|nr:growth arrest and DNA damage-inducible protein GADD45 gamma-like [Megalops cyprinoides]